VRMYSLRALRRSYFFLILILFIFSHGGVILVSMMFEAERAGRAAVDKNATVLLTCCFG